MSTLQRNYAHSYVDSAYGATCETILNLSDARGDQTEETRVPKGEGT